MTEDSNGLKIFLLKLLVKDHADKPKHEALGF